MTHRRVLRRPFARLPLAVFGTVGALLLAGCGSGDDRGQGSGDAQFVQGSGQITRVAEKERQPAPDISGETVDGERLRLSDYRGKIVVLNVWGSWCAPCRAEAPNLAKVAKETEDQGVRFIGINTRDLEKANAQAFDRSFGITYPSLYDPSGKLILKFPRNSLSPQAIPSTLIIDREGRIAVRALKALSEETLRAMLKPMLGTSGNPSRAEGMSDTALPSAATSERSEGAQPSERVVAQAGK